MPCLPEEGGEASLVPTGLSPSCAGGVAMLSDECVRSLLTVLATDCLGNDGKLLREIEAGVITEIMARGKYAQ